MIWWIIGGVVYLLSVVYVYGSFKCGFKLYLDKRSSENNGSLPKAFYKDLWSWKSEREMWLLSLMGPILIIPIILVPIFNEQWKRPPLSFCFKMPKKYCKK